MATYTPFPVSALPPVLADVANAHAEAKGVDQAMVGVPLLAATAATIGTTRRIRLREDWAERCIVWAVTVARSGDIKSPALDPVLAPLRLWQSTRMAEHADAVTAHHDAMQRYERDLARWRRDESSESPPSRPDAPTASRLIVEDVTVEALIEKLSENPRGLLLARDELAGWLRSYNAYRGGLGGDVAHWLGMHRGNAVTVDRRTGDRRLLHVPCAAVSITGTIQPGILARSLGAEHFEDGLAARLLLALPPQLPRRWRDSAPDPAVDQALAALYERLLALDFGEHGEPIDLELDADARREWVAWFNHHGEAHDRLTGNLAAASSKLEGYAARLALVHALAADPALRVVGVESVRAGCALADWFQAESARVYAVLDSPQESAAESELTEWLARQGGEATARDLMRSGPPRYRDSAATARAALHGLVACGKARRVERGHGSSPGRPAEAFRLVGDPATDATCDTIPGNPSQVPCADRPGFVPLDGEGA